MGKLEKDTKHEGPLEMPGEKAGEVSGNDDEEPLDGDVKETEISGNNEAEEVPEDTELPADTETPEDTEVPAEEEPVIEAPVVVEQEENSKAFSITVLLINETGAKFGMISVIDPGSKEQVRVGALGKDEMIIMELVWPTKEKTFRMGIYDALGNLLKEESVDFKGITSGGVITLKGDGSITEVVAEIE